MRLCPLVFFSRGDREPDERSIVRWCAVAGDHTRTVMIATPTMGGLMNFVKRTLTCLACKTPIAPSKDGYSA